MNLFLHFLCLDIDRPAIPILPFWVHTESLHFPESIDGIFHRVLKALPDIADTTHPSALVPAKRFFVKLPRRNGAGADHGQVGEGKSRKVPNFRNLKDAFEEDGD